jgi:predicted site-specific integrase-resolvase
MQDVSFMERTPVGKDTYTPKEVAVIYGRSEQTIWRWLKAGKVPGGEKSPGGSWVIWKQPFDQHRAGERKAA